MVYKLNNQSNISHEEIHGPEKDIFHKCDDFVKQESQSIIIQKHKKTEFFKENIHFPNVKTFLSEI